jgi:hypothetical protein
VTVIVAVPTFVSLVAVIVTGPTATAVTMPEEFTKAMLVLPLDQVTTRPVSTFPLASRLTADSCAVPPTKTLADDGDTDTEATATGASVVTLSSAAPLLPSLTAVIVALPAAIAVISPEAVIVATAMLLELQVTVRPVSTLFVES